ncbi:piezo-type mechanosensitive ion channel component-like isoform X2 [Zootermopsis nevadensis]|nr:piezo-type mechanosensitive ion channel component-like isoform X2 [Zootermopsis nevadensis]
MVLVWGTMRETRPGLIFWGIIIVYTAIVVIVSWLLKLQLFSLDDINLWFPADAIDLKLDIPSMIFDMTLLLLLIFLRCLVKYLENGIHFEDNSVEEDNDENMRSDVPASSPENSLADHSTMSPEDDGESNDVDVTEKNYVIMTLIKKCFCRVQKFIYGFINKPTHPGVDVYKYLFLCDIINFVLIIFAFRAFGSDVIGETQITEQIVENKVPTRFLVLLILQFTLIIVDRALYLCRCIAGKVILYYCLIFGVHIGMFFLLPSTTERKFNTQWTLQIWYLVKCFWFLLSAYQIRKGYPTYVFGKAICSRHGLFNFVLVKGFMLVPFLFELRTVLDWLCSDTSLLVFEWLKMEHIFYTAFHVKCLRDTNEQFSSLRGPPKKPPLELFIACGILLLVIGAIWFPMILFSFSMYGNDLPSEANVTMEINSYPPIYTMSAQSDNIMSMAARIYSKMHTTYMKNEKVTAFLKSYSNADIAIIKLGTVSDSSWEVTEQQKWDLIDKLQSNASVNINLKWSLSWEELGEEKVMSASGKHVHVLEAEVDGKPNPERVELLNLLKGEQHSALIFNMFPKFIRFSNHGKAPVVRHFMDKIQSDDDRAYRNVSLHLHYKGGNSSSWWDVRELCNDDNFDNYIKKFNTYDIHCHKLTLFVFNDNPLPEVLRFFSKTGVLGLYIGAIYLLSSIIRMICGCTTEKIMFYDMLNVNRILEVCSDIHKARETVGCYYERALYEKFLSMFRLPEPDELVTTV